MQEDKEVRPVPDARRRKSWAERAWESIWPEPEVEKVFLIPDEHALEYVRLWQVYVEARLEHDYLQRHAFWSFARKVCPEAFSGKGKVKLNWDDPSRPALTRIENARD